MHLDEIFNIKSIDSQSAVVELASDFEFPAQQQHLFVELGSKPIGQPPMPDAKLLTEKQNSIDENEIEWKRCGELKPQKRHLRLKNLQPNFNYFVRVSPIDLTIFGDEDDQLGDEVKSFWTEDWPESSKQIATVVNNVEFGEFYDIGKRLGRGHFGDVNLCREKVPLATEADAKVYAVKVMKVARKQQIEAAQNEVAILQDLRHENVVWLKQAIWAPKSFLYMVMEFIPGGELFEQISSDNYLLTELDCAIYIRQICLALAYIHAKRIVHLDLKVENIMLACPHRRQIKIVDFGIAKQLQPGTPCKVMCGTAEFCAPEVLKFDPISTLTDMWSVGVIAYIMLSGLSPFLGDNDSETHANVVTGDFTFDDPAFDLISDPAKDFISKLIVKQKEHRQSAEKCLGHEWLVVAGKTMEALKTPDLTSSLSFESLGDEDLDAAVSFGRRISVTAINTTKLRAYWARRKWKKACGVLRAVHKLSLGWSQRSTDRASSFSSTSGSIGESDLPSPSAQSKDMGI